MQARECHWAYATRRRLRRNASGMIAPGEGRADPTDDAQNDSASSSITGDAPAVIAESSAPVCGSIFVT